MESPQTYGPTIDLTGDGFLISQTLTLLSHPPETIKFGSSAQNLAQKTLLLWPGSPAPPPSSSTTIFLDYSS